MQRGVLGTKHLLHCVICRPASKSRHGCNKTSPVAEGLHCWKLSRQLALCTFLSLSWTCQITCSWQWQSCKGTASPLSAPLRAKQKLCQLLRCVRCHTRKRAPAVSLTCCVHQPASQPQLPVCPCHCQGGDVAVHLCGFLLPAHTVTRGVVGEVGCGRAAAALTNPDTLSTASGTPTPILRTTLICSGHYCCCVFWQERLCAGDVQHPHLGQDVAHNLAVIVLSHVQ